MTTPVTRPVTSPESAENVDTPSLEADKSPDAFINLDLPVNHINNHLMSVSQSFTYIKGVPKKSIKSMQVNMDIDYKTFMLVFKMLQKL
ncbi:hypothetical protein AAAC51_27420 [Priestia megaterium]